MVCSTKECWFLPAEQIANSDNQSSSVVPMSRETAMVYFK